MSQPAQSVGINDPITLGGRQTTLREEHRQGNVALLRSVLGARTSDQELAYWAVVRKDRESVEQFRISKNDFKLLNGRLLRPPAWSSSS